MFILDHDTGSVVDDQTGKIIYFSADHFWEAISKGNNCFICGVSPNETEFSDEHVIPRWILRKYDLYNTNITLPNGANVLYGNYTVPCCKTCNSIMSDKYENPISQLVENGYDAITEYLQREGPTLIFTWLACIFLKTHLKDKDFRFYLDHRGPDFKIADLHAWQDLHHLHCISRAFYSGAVLDKKVIGSIIVLPLNETVVKNYSPFHYGDLTTAQSMIIQLGCVCFIVVLNDSCAAYSILGKTFLNKITAPLSLLQAEEVLAHATMVNIKLIERPKFQSAITVDTCRITAELPSRGIKLDNEDPIVWKSDFGKIMLQCTRNTLDSFGTVDPSVYNNILQGKYSFLWKEDGSFCRQPME